MKTKLWLLLIVCCIVICASTASAQVCRLCNHGWCGPGNNRGGACICIVYGSGQCYTMGICWDNSCVGTKPDDFKKELENMLAKHHGKKPKQIQVAGGCVEGRKALDDLKLNYTVINIPVTQDGKSNTTAKK